MPTLFTVNTQLTQLQSVNLRHCVPLLTAITAGFQRRFSDFLTLAPEVNMAILATMTCPYFKLRWLPHTLFDQRSRFTVSVSTVKHHAMISGASSDAPNVAKDDDTDDDYFGFTESTDGTPSATDSNLSRTPHSAAKFELEALNFLEEPRKDIDVLCSYPTIKQLFVCFNAVLPSSARPITVSGVANMKQMK